MPRKTQPSRPDEREAQAAALAEEWRETEPPEGEEAAHGAAANPAAEVYTPLTPGELVPILRLGPAALATYIAGGDAADKEEARTLLDADVTPLAADITDATAVLPVGVVLFVRGARVAFTIADLALRFWARRRLRMPAKEPEATMAIVREAAR